jgi:hypothetical protein
VDKVSKGQISGGFVRRDQVRAGCHLADHGIDGSPESAAEPVASHRTSRTSRDGVGNTAGLIIRGCCQETQSDRT